MPLKLMYITNDSKIAEIAQKSGVDWIFIDLEINGKEERQGHLDTVISRHSIDDVKKIKPVLTTSDLLVRVNPIYHGSKEEIDRVINDGADIIMLPFFKSKEEVDSFVKYVDKRSKTMLLLETPEAVENIDDILSVKGIDYIHIGLNDLHLGYGMKFMFELLANGTVDKICNKIRNIGIEYGFGGIARLGKGDLPAEKIIAEHYRLESKLAILSRSFCDVNKINSYEQVYELFNKGIQEIRDFEMKISGNGSDFFKNNKEVVIELVNKIKKNCI